MDIIVFTNGCFDIIHPGHVDLLKQARKLGTKLIVGINSDRSVREIKGASRPFLDQESRAAILREMRSVDEVRIFDENTPERLIKEINPHVLVKGGDWQPGQIIGADFVLENGGRVLSIPFKQDISSSRIVDKIMSAEESARNENRALRVFEADDDDLTPKQPPARFPGLENIQRSTEIIATALSQNGKIWIGGGSAGWRGAMRLAEDLAECYGDERVLKLASTEANINLLSARDVLIVVGGNMSDEKCSDIVMSARRIGCKIIALIGEGGRKLTALSDVGLIIQAKSDSELLLKQMEIAYFWCRAMLRQK